MPKAALSHGGILSSTSGSVNIKAHQFILWKACRVLGSVLTNIQYEAELWIDHAEQSSELEQHAGEACLLTQLWLQVCLL